MKKLITLTLALALGFGLKAQCPLTQAVDFTATDCHGTEVHLFDILDGGQAVLIDFFFTTCGPCQQATPKVVESYYAMGCNMHDVFYMEIATGDSEAACLNWVNTYGVEYPTISGAAGGTGICNQYQIGAYPTVILIAPNRQIVIQDLWPISTAQDIISALEAQGLQQHDCNEPAGELTITPDTLWFSEAGQIEQFFINNGTNSDITIAEPMLNIEPNYGIRLGENTPDFPYVLEAGQTLPIDVEFLVSNSKDHYIPGSIMISTSVGLWNVVLMIYDTAIDQGLVIQGQQWVEFNDETPQNVRLQNRNYGTNTPVDILSIYENETEYLEIVPYDDLPYTVDVDMYFYITLSLKNLAKSYAQTSVTIETSEGSLQFDVLINGDLLNITESSQTAMLFPNPANESVTLKGESLGTVSIFNAVGQKVNEFEVHGREININTAGYENGVYIVKTEDGKALRFVVKH